MKRLVFALTILIALSIWSAFGQKPSEPDPPSNTVVLQLKWYHQFQFAGYYAALEQGFYRDAGLEVEIREGDPRTDSVEEVVAGRAQYGVTNSDVLLRRLRGDPVVVLAAIFQHSPLVFIATESSGIRHPQDMIGRRVGISRSTRDAELLAMLQNEGLSLDDIEPPAGGRFSYSMYFDGSADAGSAYITNEPFFLEQRNIPYRLFRPLTYGIDFYGDSLFTSEAERSAHPDRVERFREASLRGWAYAMSHKEEMIDTIIDRYGSRKSREHLLYEAEKMMELILPRLVEIGHMNPGRWRHVADTLVDLEMAAPGYDLDGFIYDPDPGPNLTRIRQVMKTLLFVTIAAGCGLFILLYFNRRLRREVREREEAEKILRFQAELMDQIQDNIVATDTEGRIIYVNEAVLKSLGKSRERMIGKTVHAFGDPETADYQREIIEKTLSEGHWRGRVVNRAEDGSIRIFESRTWTARDPGGKTTGLVGVSTDVTELTRMAEDLKAAKEAADSANQAKSRFLANMSHEIRTPMNAILGFSEILLKRTDDAQANAYLSSIHASGKALISLIDDILDLSKIEAGKMEILPEPLRIRDLLREMGAMFGRKAAEKGIALEIFVPEDFPRVLVLDETRLRQMLINLVGNAVKFTQRGHVRISVGIPFRSPEEEPAPPGRSDIVFFVEDTGCGIPRSEQERVFDPFRQREGQRASDLGGTGLGLAITRTLASLMNGEVTLESRVGRGSTFRVVFRDVPVEDDPAAEAPPCRAEEDEIRFSPATLLLVDDVPANRTLIRGFLQDQPLAIIEAQDGEHSLRLLRFRGFAAPWVEEIPRPDLILMDLRMPGMDGYEVTRRIKESREYGGLPVIAFTASAMKEEEEKTRSLFDGYIRKPVSRSQVFEALQAFLPWESVVEKPREPDPVGASSVGAAARERLPEAAARLEAEMLPRCREIMDLFYIDDVVRFAGDLAGVASEYGIGSLSAFAGDLSASAETFDVERMTRLMRGFEDLVDEIGRG